MRWISIPGKTVFIWNRAFFILTHWGRVTHIWVGNLTVIGPDNGLSPGRRQAIIWTNSWILLIGPWGTNFSKNLIGIHTFSFKKIHLKMSSAKWPPFCLSLNVLNIGLWSPEKGYRLTSMKIKSVLMVFFEQHTNEMTAFCQWQVGKLQGMKTPFVILYDEI